MSDSPTPETAYDRPEGGRTFIFKKVGAFVPPAASPSSASRARAGEYLPTGVLLIVGPPLTGVAVCAVAGWLLV